MPDGKSIACTTGIGTLLGELKFVAAWNRSRRGNTAGPSPLIEAVIADVRHSGHPLHQW